MSTAQVKKFHKSRIIAKIEIKGKNCVKPIYFEGLKKIGDPILLSNKYQSLGVDEILIVDVVSSLYRREIDFKLLGDISKNLSIPLTYAGGVKNLNDFEKCLKNGADKIGLNTNIINNIKLLKKIIDVFGAQAVLANIECQKIKKDWVCLTDGGKVNSGKKLSSWLSELKSIGVGEILIQSVRKDGSLCGPDFELIKKTSKIKIPKIYCGGVFKNNQIKNIIEKQNFDAVAISSALHFKKINLKKN